MRPSRRSGATPRRSPEDPDDRRQPLRVRRRLYRRPIHADRRGRHPHPRLGLPTLRRDLRRRGRVGRRLLPPRRPHRPIPRLHGEVPLPPTGKRRRDQGRAAPLRGADGAARRLCGDGLPARPPGAGQRLPSRQRPELHRGLRHPLGLGDGAGRPGARRPPRHRRNAAHPGRVRRPDRQELPLGRPDARPVRSARPGRRLLPAARPRRTRHRGTGLQRLLRPRRPDRHARPRRARRPHAPLGLRDLRGPGPALRGPARLGRRGPRRRRDLPVHDGRRDHAGVAHRRPHHEQRPAWARSRPPSATLSGRAGPRAGTPRRSTTLPPETDTPPGTP